MEGFKPSKWNLLRIRKKYNFITQSFIDKWSKRSLIKPFGKDIIGTFRIENVTQSFKNNELKIMIALNSHEAFTKRYVFHPVQDEIGHGGFGTIFKAVDSVRPRTVAIKRAARQKNTNITLEQEFKLCNELRHPNIISYENHYQFNTDMGVYEYIVMPYFEEGNLEKVLSKFQLSLATKHQIILDVLSGLQYLHQEQFIHRDLKPENILMKRVANQWIPVITDFGVSKLMASTASVIEISQNIISLAYATPEQLNGQREVRKNIDLWPVGVLLYRMLTGELPFSTQAEPFGNSTYWEVAKKIRDCVLPARCYTLPQPYQRVILSCLQTDPMKRVQSAQELITQLGPNPPTPLPQQALEPDEEVLMGILDPNEVNADPMSRTMVEPAPNLAFEDKTQVESDSAPVISYDSFRKLFSDSTQQDPDAYAKMPLSAATQVDTNLAQQNFRNPSPVQRPNTDSKNEFNGFIMAWKYIVYGLFIGVGIFIILVLVKLLLMSLS